MSELNFVLYDQNIWGNYSGGESVSNRNELVCKMVNEYDAGICCFQECNPNTSRADDVDIAKLMSPKYAEVLTPVNKQNYTPIFYNVEKFQVENSGFCAFPGFNDVNSKSLTWCVFKDIKTEIRFCVISTHFWYKSRDQMDEMQRLENAKIVLSHVNSLKIQHEAPVFVCGDLNNGPESTIGESTWLYMKENMQDVRDIAKVTTDAKTCHTPPKKNDRGIYDVKAGECVCTLDHIFLNETKNVKVHSFEIDNSDCSWSSSDHCPVIANITITGV